MLYLCTVGPVKQHMRRANIFRIRSCLVVRLYQTTGKLFVGAPCVSVSAKLARVLNKNPVSFEGGDIWVSMRRRNDHQT